MLVKRIAIVIGCLAVGVLYAQEASTNRAPDTVSTVMEAPAPTPGDRTVQSISRPDPSVPPGGVEVGGAIPKAIRARNLFQMINPLAPKEYGDGTDVLARHPITGEAQGVTLFLVTCPAKPKPPKAPKPKHTPPARSK